MPTCRKNKDVSCNDCKGFGGFPCVHCGCTGKYRLSTIGGGKTRKAGTETCDDCEGRGLYDCKECKNGKVECRECVKGKIPKPCTLCRNTEFIICEHCKSGGYCLWNFYGDYLVEKKLFGRAGVFYAAAETAAQSLKGPRIQGNDLQELREVNQAWGQKWELVRKEIGDFLTGENLRDLSRSDYPSEFEIWFPQSMMLENWLPLDPTIEPYDEFPWEKGTWLRAHRIKMTKELNKKMLAETQAKKNR